MLSVVAADALHSFQHDNRVATDDLEIQLADVQNLIISAREGEQIGHTTMPSLIFSPPSFSSTASSKTTFRKTCSGVNKVIQALRSTSFYIHRIRAGHQ